MYIFVLYTEMTATATSAGIGKTSEPRRDNSESLLLSKSDRMMGGKDKKENSRMVR